MTTQLERLLVTGAAGKVAQQALPFLAQFTSELRLSDVKQPEFVPKNAQFIPCELADRPGLCCLMREVDGVVHLGGFPVETDFDTLLDPNIIGVHNLYEAARVNNCPRIVFATSNHVTGFYDQETKVGPETRPRPDSWYAVTKVFGETVAQLYHDKVGQETALVRIGSITPEPTDYRMLSTWFSAKDFAALSHAALTTKTLGCRVIYGASNNALSWWDNSAHSDLGWHPQDSSDAYEEQLRKTRQEPDHPMRRYQGGVFAVQSINEKAKG
jgi:uronate dehydrogenase